MRQHPDALVAFVRPRVPCLAAPRCLSEALDSAGIPIRDAKRRGAGWLPGLAEIGWSNRLGWYAGFPLRLAVNPVGVMTGFGLGPARTKDHPLADTFVALRCPPSPALPSVGAPARGPYVVDKGVEGQANHMVWWQTDGAQVLCPPKRHSTTPWPKALRRWLAGSR